VRRITHNEMSKRGCLYCADCECGSGKHTECRYHKCPYHELDNVKTYGEYIQKSNKSGLARVLANLTKDL
jgi:hypothetical protein